MTFYFFGLFTDSTSDLKRQLLALWPDTDIVRMAKPFSGLAARFSERTYEPELEDLPESVSDEIKRLSMSYPDSLFLLLRTNCWGGECHNWGHTIRQGKIVYETKGDEALRRLFMQFGIDLGSSEIFPPLMRDFPWEEPPA